MKMLGPQAQRKSALHFPQATALGSLMQSSWCLYFSLILFIYLWLWGSSLLPGLFSGCRELAFQSCRLSLQWHLLLQSTDARASRLQGCSSRALGHRLNGCGARAKLLQGRWDLSGSGIKLCLLHSQADSPPLRHQEAPTATL